MDLIFLIVINVISAIILVAYIINGSKKRKRIKAAEAAKESQKNHVKDN